MRFSILVSAVLALIFAPITITADKGYRRVKFPASELYPKFAEYDDENCVDLFGKGGEARDYLDFIPQLHKCYNLKNDTVSFYHERGFMSKMWLYPEYGCKGKSQLDKDFTVCQPVERNWNPHVVRSFKMS